MADAWLNVLKGYRVAFVKKFPREVLNVLGEREPL